MELSEDSVPRHPVYRVRDDYYIDESKSSQIVEIKDYKATIIDTSKFLFKMKKLNKANWKLKKAINVLIYFYQHLSKRFSLKSLTV